MPDTTRDMRFQAVLPTMQKSVVYQPDGSFYIGGICSDPSLDLQGDRVDQASVLAHADYLKSWGKLNWNHQAEAIGDIEEVRRITPEEAAREFGRKLEGDGTYMKARIYPVVAPVNGVDVNHEDLKRAHQRAQADAHMGFSLQGKLRRVGGVAYPTAIYQTALCDQAVNTNTCAVPMAKSMAEALDEWEAGQPDVVIEYGEVEALEKSEFADPFPGLRPGEQFAAPDLVRAIRQCIASEQEAIATYEAIADAAAGAGEDYLFPAAKVLRSVADEERTHAGEFLALLDTLNGSEGRHLAEGAAEVDDLIAEAKTPLLKGLLAMAKSHVKGHTRTVGGKIVPVKEYDDKRTAADGAQVMPKEQKAGAALTPQDREKLAGLLDLVETRSRLTVDIVKAKEKARWEGAAEAANACAETVRVMRLGEKAGAAEIAAFFDKNVWQSELVADSPLLSKNEKTRQLNHGRSFGFELCAQEVRRQFGLAKSLAEELADPDNIERLRKSLDTNATTDEAALEGGASFRKQSLKPRLVNTGWKCSKCGLDCAGEEPMCKCGAKREPSLLAKGLAALAKSHVKGHTRTVGGKIVPVKEHEDKRTAGQAVSAAPRWKTDDELVGEWKTQNPRPVKLAAKLEKMSEKTTNFANVHLRRDLQEYLEGDKDAAKWLADFYGVSAISSDYDDLLYRQGAFSAYKVPAQGGGN